MSDSNRGSKESISGAPEPKRQKLIHERSSSPKRILTSSTSVRAQTSPTLLSGSDHPSNNDAMDIVEASAKPPENANTNTPNAINDSTQQTEHIEAPDVVFGESQIEDLAGIEDAVARPENTAEE